MKPWLIIGILIVSDAVPSAQPAAAAGPTRIESNLTIELGEPGVTAGGVAFDGEHLWVSAVRAQLGLAAAVFPARPAAQAI